MAPAIGSVKIYNSAGELVATLYEELPLYKIPLGLTSVVDTFAPGPGAAGVLELLGPDLPLVWSGSADTGQMVSGGVYNVVVEVKDAFGASTTWTKALTVVRTDNSTVIEVYNSAGELVWHSSAVPTAPGLVGVSAHELAPGAGSPGLKISYGSGSGDSVNWDGTGSGGQALSSGTYLVKVTQGGATTAYSITLLQPNTQAFAWVAAAPNPVPAGSRSVMISLQGAAPGVRAWGEAYDLAGEHVGSLATVSGAFLHWDIPSGLASGVYLLQISARDAQGRLKTAMVKLAILR